MADFLSKYFENKVEYPRNKNTYAYFWGNGNTVLRFHGQTGINIDFIFSENVLFIDSYTLKRKLLFSFTCPFFILKYCKLNLINTF